MPFHLALAQTLDFKTADSLAAVGKHLEAIDLLEQAEDKSDNTYLKIAQYQQVTGKNAEALESFRRVLILNPDRVLPALSYGELLLETGKLELADSLFTKLNAKYPENASFVYRLGLTKEMKKDSTAIGYFFETVELDSTHQGALYKTAKHHLKNGKPHNAIKLSKTGLKYRPENISLLSILGQAYSASLQFEKAISAYEKLVELGEGSEFILEKLAKAYRLTSQTEKAINTYKMMLEINDKNNAVHSNLGALYLQANKTKKAQLHFTMALLIKKQPVDREYTNIGITFKRQADYQNAYTNFRKALEENPKNERALIELALAADGYFEDKESVLQHYQNYVDKYKGSGRRDMLSVAEFRISELRREIHLAE